MRAGSKNVFYVGGIVVADRQTVRWCWYCAHRMRAGIPRDSSRGRTYRV